MTKMVESKCNDLFFEELDDMFDDYSQDTPWPSDSSTQKKSLKKSVHDVGSKVCIVGGSIALIGQFVKTVSRILNE